MKKKRYGMNVGISSLLVILVILCLVCFAGLSVVSAVADQRLTDKLAVRTTSYYEAVSLANKELSTLDEQLHAFYEESTSEEDFLGKIKESFADPLTFSYEISDTQSLVVSVTPIYPQSSADSCLSITQFQVVTTANLTQDTSLSVLTRN